jgi:tetratricopeptide (TPR) repeat protein
VNAPPDRDYFTAHEDPEAFRDLTLNDLYHTNRVLHSIQVARYDEAIADLRFVLEKWPNHPRALLLIESLGQVTQALELPTPYYEKAIRLYPQYAMTFAQYGKYLVEIGQWDKGVENLKRAIEKDRKMVAAHVWLSQAYDKHGDKISAKKEADLARNLGFEGDFSPDLGQSSHRTKPK